MYAAAQIGEVLDGLQSAFCFRCKRGQRWRQQVAEGLLVASAHASAHLVQVAQTEVLRLVDEDGVGVGDVDAALYDGGGQQHVVVVVHEAKDDFLQLGGLHLSVAYADAAVGDAALYHGLQFGKV